MAQIPSPASASAADTPARLPVAAMLVFLVAAWMIVRFSILTGHEGVWHGFGLAVGFLLRFGLRFWPGVAAGSFIVTFASGLPLMAEVSTTLANTLGSMLGTRIFQRQGLDRKLGRLQDYLGLIIVGALFAPFVSATLDIGFPLLSGDTTLHEGIREAWLNHWMADSLGVMTTAPILLLWLNGEKAQPLTVRRWMELTLLMGATVLFGAILFFDWHHEIFAQYTHGYLVLPLIVIAAVDFGRRITALGSLILFALSTSSMQFNSGLFANVDAMTAMYQLWLFVSIISIAGMTLATVFFELRTAQKVLIERERMLRAIYDNSSVAIGFVSPDGRITHANRHMAELFGFTPEEVVGQNYYDCVHPQDRESSHDRIRALAVSQVDVVEIERHYLRKDGREFWGQLTSRRVCDENGRMIGLVGVIYDITDRKAANARLRLAAQVFESSHEGIIITSAQNRIVSVNSAFTKITGYAADEAIGQGSDLLRSGRHDDNLYADLVRQLDESGHWEGEIWNKRKDGSVFPGWISISVVRDERGEIENYISILSDITERKAAEDRIRHLAQYDFLTDLPNRALLFDRLTREFFEARRYDKRFALLFIDLDRFKPVNDEFGHAAGDALLREVAHRLAGNVRDSDTVSRQGGDEFIILVPELQEAEQAVQLGVKLLRILQEPYLIDNHAVRVSSSIGIAVYPEDGEDIDTLMKNADTAMYRAKNAGRNNLQCYGAELNALARRL